jgi:putative AlgH/UPF0301 family transcriptional regulator
MADAHAAADYLTGHCLTPCRDADPRFEHTEVYLCAHSAEGRWG